MVDHRPSLLGRVYLWAIPVAGIATTSWAVTDLVAHPPSPYWIALALLTALTGSFTVRIPGMVARLSVSEPFVFAAALLFGPAAGTVTVAIDACVMSLRLLPSLRTPHRVLFNVGTLALSVTSSSFLFFWLSGIDARAPDYPSVDTFIWPLYAFSACCFVVNSSIVAVAISIERRVSAISTWREQFMWVSVNYFAEASVAALIVVFARTFDIAILGIVIPLVAISYLTFRTTLGRLDDANRHLGDLNALHLSTIETLAMAIDAKDQVTHGHIRRVQRYATGLARAIGIVNERQVRAIEAAALLHDMGKLAIPEFILNKPGRLTPREFSVMKTHAAAGADLLSSIKFPYPVVPIVRHHHENWDGTGYPDGLRGAAIPIGARILAVVDCYDALTSHRPYRPAMSAEAALEILTQRRGRMYDPLVVDAFVREHAALRAEAETPELPAALLINQPERTPAPPPDAPVAQDTPVDSLRVLANLRPFPDAPPFRAVCRQLIDSLRDVAPFDTAVVYALDEISSDAHALYADGSLARAVLGIRIPVAERLSGWVAAHRTAVWNSDAALDLSLAGVESTLAVGSSLPLCANDAMIGVLSLYGRPDQEISASQRHTLESLLPSMSVTLDAALQRPALAIDCASPAVGDAGLSALDALLSHGRRGEGEVGGSPHVVLSVSIRRAASDLHPSVDLEAATVALAQCLSPATEANRCVLVLGPGHVLLCSLDDASRERLEHEVSTRTAKVRLLADFATTAAFIRSSLELKARVQRVRESLELPEGTTAPPARIH